MLSIFGYILQGSTGPSSPNCLLKVDEDGFFLLWSFTNQQVWDYFFIYIVARLSSYLLRK